MNRTGADTQEIERLLEQAREGRPSAYDDLIGRTAARLLALARKMFRAYPQLRHWEETDDVFQQSMMRLHRSLADVRPESARAYLGLASTQIRRTLIDLTRHHFGPEGEGKHQAPVESPDDHQRLLGQQPSRVERPETLAQWAHFHEAIENLPSAEREVFSLLWYCGLNQKAVAELLDVSPRTIMRRMHRARLHLYDILQGEAPSPE